MLDESRHSGNFGFHDKRFDNGKIIAALSIRPEAPTRLWKNFKRYIKYSPQETIAFPIVHIYSKFLGKDID